MGRLIIHADDFGLTEKVNTGILQGFLEGSVTSTSIMATGTAFEHAIAICQDVPTLDAGIHLTLVGEKPILSGEVIKSLVNQEGRLHDHTRHFVQRYYCGHISLKEVQLELEAQIQKVLNTGIEISHLDSHQHLHMLPHIRSITVSLAQKYNIAAVRFPCEQVSFAMLRDRPCFPRIIQLLVLDAFCYMGRTMNVARTDRFFGFLYGGKMNKRNLLKTIERLPETGICELMCHPGVQDPDSPYTFWGYHWQDELNALLDPDIKTLLNHKGISLVSYRDLVLDAAT